MNLKRSFVGQLNLDERLILRVKYVTEKWRADWINLTTVGSFLIIVNVVLKFWFQLKQEIASVSD